MVEALRASRWVVYVQAEAYGTLIEGDTIPHWRIFGGGRRLGLRFGERDLL